MSDTSSEKATKVAKEFVASSSTVDVSEGSSEWDAAEEKRAVRLLDLTVIPMVGLFYFMSFLDRGNIGNARVAGLQKDLNMTDHQYSLAITFTYLPYLLAELPGNLILRRVGANVLMPTLLVLWGVMVTLQGVVKTFGGLLALRIFIGAFEGPMFPGIVLYLSGFYTREELSLRVSLFFSAASLSGAFSGLLAAAIENMDGIGGRPGWAWIFIIEGCFTILIGLLVPFLVPRTPRHSRFLTEKQKDIIMRRIEKERPTVNIVEEFSPKEILKSLKSPHVWIMIIILFSAGTTLFGLAVFLPSIVKQFGFGANKTQLVSVGPFAAAFVATMIAAHFSDRYRTRALPVIISSAVAIVGFVLYLASDNFHVRYGSLFLSVPGIYVIAPIASTWMANNSEPYYRRATSVAIGFMGTNCGGILSTWTYPSNQAPNYKLGMVLNIALSAVMLIGACVNAYYLNWRNKQKESKRNVLLAPYITSEYPDGGRAARLILGDDHPDFRYAL